MLANKAKEEQAVRRNDPSKLTTGPRNQISQGDGPVNADGMIFSVQVHALTVGLLANHYLID